jgi:hypothetical protein
MRMVGSLLSIALLGVCLCGMNGCAATADDAQLHAMAKTPPDFAVELFVDGSLSTKDPRIIRSKYLLEPNFRLHLALGDQAAKNHFPVRYLKLKIEQFQQIVNVAQQNNLMAEPTSPYAEEVMLGKTAADPNRPLLYMSITSWGKTNRYVTTGTDSPPTQVLLEQMILMTGRSVPDEALDAHRGY